MKILFKISFIALIVLLFVYVGYAFVCNQKQIKIAKKNYISFILNREIELRKLYAKKKGDELTLTELEKRNFEKEKLKFYRYCNSSSWNRYCTIKTDIKILRATSYMLFHKELIVNIQYKFDDESIKFFNSIKTYTGAKGRNLHFENNAYQATINGWNSEFRFFDCEEDYLAYVEEDINVSNKLISKKELINIKGNIEDSKKISYRFDTFIKLEK